MRPPIKNNSTMFRCCLAFGRLLGHYGDQYGDQPVYALDNMVFRFGANKIWHMGDYFEWCDEVREGKHPAFKPHQEVPT